MLLDVCICIDWWAREHREELWKLSTYIESYQLRIHIASRSKDQENSRTREIQTSRQKERIMAGPAVLVVTS